MKRSDWLKSRRVGLGGSDVAPILGLSPWRSAMDVWLDKKGLREEVPDPDRDFLLDLGAELEPVIARLYERQTKKKLLQSLRVTHPQHEILFAHPDRLIASERRGVELKSENKFSDQFGDPGSEDVPVYYYLQCAHYMSVMDFNSWDLALLHGGSKFAIYTLHRDKALEAEITAHLLDWWDRYVVKDVPPEVDGSAAWRKYLAKKFPIEQLPAKHQDARSEPIIQKLLFAQAGLKHYEEIFDEMSNRLKLEIGDHEGIHGDFGKITWRKTKDAKIVSWQDVAINLSNLAGKEEFDRLVELFTNVRPGSRRFLISPKKGWVVNGNSNAEIEAGVGSARILPAATGALQEGDRAGAAETSKR